MFDKYIEAVKGAIPRLIALAVAFVVAHLIYMLIPNGYAFDIMLLVKSVSAVAAAGITTVLTVTALDQG